MAQINALSAYWRTRIKTASRGRLVTLCEGGILGLDRALELLRPAAQSGPERAQEAGEAILRTREIITELALSLDFERGGRAARSLLALFAWFNKELQAAQQRPDAERIRTVRNYMDDMRKFWTESADIKDTRAEDTRAKTAGRKHPDTESMGIAG